MKTPFKIFKDQQGQWVKTDSYNHYLLFDKGEELPKEFEAVFEYFFPKWNESDKAIETPSETKRIVNKETK